MGRAKLPSPKPSAVLVIDRDRLLRWSFAAVLAERGHPVWQAESLTEARAALKLLDGQPVIVLIEVWPRHGSDLSRVSEVHAVRPDAPIIVLEASDGCAAETPRANEPDVYRFITKPIDLLEIVDAVSDAARAEAFG